MNMNMIFKSLNLEIFRDLKNFPKKLQRKNLQPSKLPKINHSNFLKILRQPKCFKYSLFYFMEYNFYEFCREIISFQ